MRSLPGLLIEYLINGAVAFIWIRELFSSLPPLAGGDLALLLIPVLYVVGMAVDLTAFVICYVPKHILRRRLDKTYGQSTQRGGTRRKVFIISKSEEIAGELEKRSSRDRIARGTLVNLLPLLFIWGIQPLIAVFSLVFVFVAWLWFESQSYRFELQAASILGYRDGKDYDLDRDA